ncbi:MAG TPA: chemotaxis protein CheW [Methanospirillum sp.]|uniref:chemotaxis protein CheW n=1 Tax=Methanospirillum sp. TaxID=45200 RepID=UPI002B9DD475|nr:chemotaxis protein CheW [Methanospirillum sp.]HOJ97778.1 chemotaxis protein CheW [Methanospirillum sp.]HPP77563.1 chemotaxis protein CheW [Methanospirillum sp.]
MERYLFFSVGNLRCGIPFADAITMIRMVSITPVRKREEGLVGTINLHGEIISVYSARELFGFPKRSPLPGDNLIIVRKGLENVALWVDKTYIIQKGELVPDERFPHEHVQTMIPGIKIFSSHLIVIFDLVEFLEYGSKSQTRLADILQPLPDEGEETDIVTVRDQQDIERVLQERSIQLALPEEEKTQPPVIEIIRFNLMYQEYAVEMKYIREVIQTSEITPVPGTPDFIAGICSVRGEIISLIDLRPLLSIPEKGLTDLNRVIVLTDGNLTFGILADQITGIGTLTTEDIVRTDENHLKEWQNIICGTKDSLKVLNAQALLTDPRMIIDDTET